MENTQEIEYSRIETYNLLRTLMYGGRDGRDITKGALIAVRAFIEEHIGADKTEAEFETLVAELKRMGD